MGGSGTPRWIKSFRRRCSSLKPHAKQQQQPPNEFLCPISGSLMSDPVVVTSGKTYERMAVQVCTDLGFWPELEDGSGNRPDPTSMVPNLAIKSTILQWCENAGLKPPHPPDYSSVEKLVRTAIEKSLDNSRESQIRVSERESLKLAADNPPEFFSDADSEPGHPINYFDSSSSEESVIITSSPPAPLPLETQSSCYSSCMSSSENIYTETQNEKVIFCEEEDELLLKLKSPEVLEQKDGVISLRNITRNREETRCLLCSPSLLLALRPLITSRYSVIQTNAVASVVNLSIEKSNKGKIVRSGFVPSLIDILKGGFSESQEHAAAALFSLALDDNNKMAIGYMGGLQPMMHALRSESERTQQDSALALYHLTLAQSNRIKLVKLGAVPTLLTMLKTRKLASRVLLILCNVAACPEGRTAMLEADAVKSFMDLLRNKELDSESTHENCLAALYALSHGNGSLRFKVLATEARTIQVLKETVESGSERARHKAGRILEMMKPGDEDMKDLTTDWERFLQSSSASFTSMV